MNKIKVRKNGNIETGLTHQKLIHDLISLVSMATDLFVSTKAKKEEEEERVREEISKLPRVNGWVTNHLYQYQGFWYRDKVVEGIVYVQNHFKARPTDILLATNPKSGTIWLKALAFAIINRTKYLKYSSEPHPLLISNPHKCVPGLEFEAFLNNSWAEIEDQVSPRLYATHMPYTSLPESVLNSGCKIVYLCRNPKDLLVSMWHFLEKFKNKEIPRISLQEACESFCRGDSPFGPYWDHVLGYYKASLKCTERILFVKYEDIHEEHYNQVKKLAEFLGCPFSLEEEREGVVDNIIRLCRFENMRNLEVNKKEVHDESRLKNDAFFRKGEVGDSKNYLTDQMVETLEKMEENLQSSGLSFY